MPVLLAAGRLKAEPGGESIAHGGTQFVRSNPGVADRCVTVNHT
jgi:hypothetical protein